MRTYSTGQAKEGASADSAEEMKHSTTVRRWRLHAEAIGIKGFVSGDVGEDEVVDWAAE